MMVSLLFLWLVSTAASRVVVVVAVADDVSLVGQTGASIGVIVVGAAAAAAAVFVSLIGLHRSFCIEYKPEHWLQHWNHASDNHRRFDYLV